MVDGEYRNSLRSRPSAPARPGILSSDLRIDRNRSPSLSNLPSDFPYSILAESLDARRQRGKWKEVEGGTRVAPGLSFYHLAPTMKCRADSRTISGENQSCNFMLGGRRGNRTRAREIHSRKLPRVISAGDGKERRYARARASACDAPAAVLLPPRVTRADPRVKRG